MSSKELYQEIKFKARNDNNYYRIIINGLIFFYQSIDYDKETVSLYNHGVITAMLFPCDITEVL